MTKDERTVYVFALRYALPRHSYALSIVSQMIYWCGKWQVRKWRSLIDGTLCTDDGEAIQRLMVFKGRYKYGKD